MSQSGHGRHYGYPRHRRAGGSHRTGRPRGRSSRGSPVANDEGIDSEAPSLKHASSAPNAAVIRSRCKLPKLLDRLSLSLRRRVTRLALDPPLRGLDRPRTWLPLTASYWASRVVECAHRRWTCDNFRGLAQQGLISPTLLRSQGRAAHTMAGPIPYGCVHPTIALKRCMFSVMAISVGNRSMLDAPKKPTTPCVRAST